MLSQLVNQNKEICTGNTKITNRTPNVMRADKIGDFNFNQKLVSERLKWLS
jgi:hypothetical protein